MSPKNLEVKICQQTIGNLFLRAATFFWPKFFCGLNSRLTNKLQFLLMVLALINNNYWENGQLKKLPFIGQKSCMRMHFFFFKTCNFLCGKKMYENAIVFVLKAATFSFFLAFHTKRKKKLQLLKEKNGRIELIQALKRSNKKVAGLKGKKHRICYC